MSDESQKIDELKQDERLKIEVPADETAGSARSETIDVTEEFKRLGRQFGAALESLFTSDEAKRIEGDVREGVKSFANEVEKAVRDVAASPAADRLRADAVDLKTRVESGDVSRKAQATLVEGLRWLSAELERAADNFGKASAGAGAKSSPADVEDIIVEKSPQDEA
jgi:BMFP domain-containing protein YqiC